MSRSKVKTARRIKDVNLGQESETQLSHVSESVFVKRSRLRKIDLASVMGTARESARVYKDLIRGEISMVEADVRSRILKRHAEVLTEIEKAEQLKQMQEQLDRIEQGSPPGQTFLPRPDFDTPEAES
jgi:hypothetical protein